nr:hypothetical protein CFP56_20644 [Quercus suber]
MLYIARHGALLGSTEAHSATGWCRTPSLHGQLIATPLVAPARRPCPPLSTGLVSTVTSCFHGPAVPPWSRPAAKAVDARGSEGEDHRDAGWKRC